VNDPESRYSYTQTLIEAEEQPRGSFWLLRVLIVAAFLLLILQLVNIQIVNGEYFRRAADQNRFRLTSTDALRGIVYDRRGKILARNVPAFNVSIVPADFPLKERERVYQRLAALLQVPIDTVIENIAEDAVGSLPSALHRAVISPKRKPGLRELVTQGERDPFTPVRVKDNVPREIAFYLEENRLDFPGVIVGLTPVREYVEGASFAHILGYTGPIPREEFAAYRAQGYAPNDQVGLTGIEATFETELRGIKGRRYIEVDVTGREVALLASEPPTPGHNLVLTLDAEFQANVQAILQKGLRNARAKQGVAIALDPRDGEILAMVTLPSYDNNLFATGISTEALTNLIQDPLRPLVNHAIAGQYPPGSVFKMVPASAALQERVVDINTRLETPGTIWVPHKYYPDDLTLAQPFYDWYKPGFGALTIREGIAWSSDVFFYKIAGGESPTFDTGLGEQRLAAYARMFGFGELTGIDLPGEAKGLVPDPTWKRKTIGDVWTIGDTYNMGIGQGYVLATPLQIANMTAAVANGGTLYKPLLVRDVRDTQGRITRALEPQVIRRLGVDPQNLAIVREGMREAVMRGTATKANLADVNVAAKTGTAEFYGPKVNGHLPTHAWFTAFAPYEDPQIVVTVFVYGGGEGSEVAAPIAADILRAYFHLPSNAPLASTAPVAPPVVAPRPPAPNGAPVTTHKYVGRLLGVDGWNSELPGIFGTVVDVSGRGVPGVRVVVDKCDSNVVFAATTDANGAFNFSTLYWKDSARWCVRTVAPTTSEPFAVEVVPYKRYTVQFVPTR
jgi:penicillin-binding protein 2